MLEETKYIYYSISQGWTGWYKVYVHTRAFPKGICFAKFINENDAKGYVEYLNVKAAKVPK